jgi:D-alanyl-D-alanine carboxypeptidase (penicillin-binding protein 5/6)
MLNIILTILALPFLPFFMYGNLKMTNDNVLGESTATESAPVCNTNQPGGAENYTIFPLDSYTGGEYTPIRKPDYKDIKIWSGSSVAIDVDSGTILEYSDGRKQTQIASLTKIMTAVLAVENVKNLDEETTLTAEALHVDGTTVGCPTSVFCNSESFHIGEKVTVRNLLKAMLLDSANDAATAIGIHIAGTPDNFVQIMNKKAQDLGLKDTHFCTPSGLEIDGQESQCYSSAYDIARIAAYSLKYNLIWDIMRTEDDQFSSADGKYTHTIKNTDLLLSQMPDCIGGKTGFTPMAGKSLLLAAADPTKKHRIISVILDDENRWQDMRSLVDWVFSNYEWR